MIKFIESKTEKNDLLLKDVKENQFFVDLDGCLCQKLDNASYIKISDSENRPFADYVTPHNANSLKIKKILPCIEKIEF